MENKQGIYKILNNKTNKVYIGSSVDIFKRFREHKHSLLKNKHRSPKLQNSYNIHGASCFIFELIELVICKNELLEREQFYIDAFDSYHNGYNSRPKAEANYGRIVSDETKKKISDKLKGSIGPNKGLIMSDETKAKISKTKKGRPSNRKNFKHSEAAKQKMSQLRKGIKWNKNYVKPSEETKDKIRQTMLKKGLGGKPKPCKINDIIYESAKMASTSLNIPYQTVIDRIKSNNFTNWFFL
jgi:hypothetical protein